MARRNATFDPTTYRRPTDWVDARRAGEMLGRAGYIAAILNNVELRGLQDHYRRVQSEADTQPLASIAVSESLDEHRWANGPESDAFPETGDGPSIQRVNVDRHFS